MDQIDAGVLSNRIIFNSIVDNPKIDNYGNNDEHNFIVAREADKGGLWQTETIEAENNLSYDDKIYDICVRLKNDNPNGIDAISKETKVFLDMPKYSARTIPVQARIESENARPRTYTSVIYFHGTTDFKLEYIKDSARLINNGIGKENGIKLDDIFNQDGIIIGYSSLNGEIPGGEEYASYIVFKAKAIFNAKDIKYNVTTTVRLVGDSDKSWKKEVDAKIGDKVEFRIEYENTSDARQNNIAIADILPSDLHYVKGTTKLYNDSFPKGALVDSDEVVASGIYVGHYEPGANAIIRFQAEVVDDDFTCGKFILHNWGRASIGEKVMQDSAAVVVQLPYCPDLGVESTTKE